MLFFCFLRFTDVFLDNSACKAASLECGRENNDQKICITCLAMPD